MVAILNHVTDFILLPVAISHHFNASFNFAAMTQ